MIEEVFEEVLDLVAMSKLPDPTEPLARSYWKGDLAVWKNRSNSPPSPAVCFLDLKLPVAAGFNH